ncbi:MAG: hypothetical protein OXU88_04820 [Gammaproteobacteria bacterium]|nr:hypothetical protein [Gammaproteobacteria bacterium]
MNIFIDVGGHLGETLDELFNLSHRFNVVHCLEPQAMAFSFMENKFAEQIAAGKLKLHNFGLANFDGEAILYGGESCSLGASLFEDKVDVDSKHAEKCKFVKASTFVKNVVQEDDFAVMKLNCEGGEALILRDLMQNRTIHLLNSIYIDFDVVKIPSQATEQQKIIAEMQASHYSNYMTMKDLHRVDTWSFRKRQFVSRKIGGTCGYGFPRIKIWLSLIEGAEKVVDLRIMGRVVRYLPKSVWGRGYRIKRIFRKRFLARAEAEK